MHDRSVMFQKIVEMNGKGADFYDRACAACSDPLGETMFSMLRKEKEVLLWQAMMLGAKPAISDGSGLNIIAGENRMAPRAHFRKLAVRYSPSRPPFERELETLDLALEMEKAVVGYYSGQFAEAIDEEERGFIEGLIGSGQDAILLITDLQYYYSDPQGWVRTAKADGPGAA